MEWTRGGIEMLIEWYSSFHFCLMPNKPTIIIKLSALMSLGVTFWMSWANDSCAKSCGDSSGPSTVVLAAAHDRLPELAYFVTMAGPMCIAFVFWLFYFLLAPLPLERLPKCLRLNHQTPCFLCEILVCINWTKFHVRVSRTSFLDGELGSSVMGWTFVLLTPHTGYLEMQHVLAIAWHKW